jgi:DNA polymerase-3 subunit chi
MTAVDFYFNADDRLQVACRLAAKALERRQRVMIYAPEAAAAQDIDRLLWTWPATGFLPHCAAGAALAAETPVLIARDAADPAGCAVLLNLSTACPPHFERFERLLEVVGPSEDERAAARGRFRAYRARGYAIASHDLAAPRAEPR